MPQVIEKNSIMINKEPMVLLPLRKWQKISSDLEELEEAARFNKVYTETRGQKTISLAELKKKYKLK